MQPHSEPAPVAPPAPRPRFGCLHLLGAVLIAVLVTACASYFILRAVFNPKPFTPVQLNHAEELVLQDKLDRIGSEVAPVSGSASEADTRGHAEPEAYDEKGADRTIRITERELNALLAKNTDLAGKLAIDLSKGLISAKLLLPLDEDFPILGGKTLRVKTGMAFRYAEGRPVVSLRGVMVMGVPLPNAWLGGLKNVDLVQEFGGDEGFWKAFADGFDHFSIEDDAVVLTLKE